MSPNRPPPVLSRQCAGVCGMGCPDSGTDVPLELYLPARQRRLLRQLRHHVRLHRHRARDHPLPRAVRLRLPHVHGQVGDVGEQAGEWLTVEGPERRGMVAC